MSCGIGHRHGSNPALLCLWHRPAGIAPTLSLACELPHASGVVLKSKKKKIQKNLQNRTRLKDFETKFMVTKRETGVGDKLEV